MMANARIVTLASGKRYLPAPPVAMLLQWHPLQLQRPRDNP